MSLGILLNDSSYQLKESGLPCLITYRDKSGGSQFSVTLIADLFLRGSKVLIFTAYPMAKENFLEQIKGQEGRVVYVEKEDYLVRAQNYQAVIIKSGDANLYLKALELLSDIVERVVLLKNMEVFDREVIAKSLQLPKVVFSGDIDKCVEKTELAKKEYKTIIIFSKSEISLPIEPPELEKYSAYLWSAEGEEGIVKVKI
jgi:hypothetical protein